MSLSWWKYAASSSIDSVSDSMSDASVVDGDDTLDFHRQGRGPRMMEVGE